MAQEPLIILHLGHGHFLHAGDDGHIVHGDLKTLATAMAAKHGGERLAEIRDGKDGRIIQGANDPWPPPAGHELGPPQSLADVFGSAERRPTRKKSRGKPQPKPRQHMSRRERLLAAAMAASMAARR